LVEQAAAAYGAAVTSNLECVGLGVPDRDGFDHMVRSALRGATQLGTVGRVKVLRWQDSSGVRLVLAVEGSEVVDLLPSYAAEPGANLADLRPANGEVAIAMVMDDNGEQVTSFAVELEQRQFLGGATTPAAGRASVVALGVEVSVHADEEAFAASPASLLSPRDDDADPAPPPPHFVENGWPWPPRMGAESFVSHGVFTPERPNAYGRLHGTVLHAERHTVALTGQDFIAARVRTAGFEADVCLAAADHPTIPTPGQVIGGTVFLVASLEHLTSVRTRPRWLPSWNKG
jgi:hypothetical protein